VQLRDKSYASNRHTTAVAERLRAVLANHPDLEIGLEDPASDADLPTLAKAGLILLARKPEFEGRDGFASSLALDQRYHYHLINPKLLSLDETTEAAQAMSKADTSFLAGLLRAADETPDPPFLMRTLEIIGRLNKSSVAAQWIRRLSTHDNAAVRSKAVKMLSCLHVNLAFIEKQLGSPEPRVRANAVEALWRLDSGAAIQLLERAASDPHHRVSVNGLLGLCWANVPSAPARLIKTASAEAPLLRAAAAWAMGQLESAEFEEELAKLATDSEESVRNGALRSLDRRRSLATV
jgi:hypothetical protein